MIKKINKKFQENKSVMLVRYQDSEIQEGQHELRDYPDTFISEVVGFFIMETHTQIVLTQEIFDNGDCRRSIAIPKIAILNKRMLRK